MSALDELRREMDQLKREHLERRHRIEREYHWVIAALIIASVLAFFGPVLWRLIR